MRYLLYISICLILCSCHTGYYIEGVVKDSSNGKPLGQAKVFLKTIDTVVTDSSGTFVFDKHLTGGHVFSDVEIMIEKDGFKSQYVNFGDAGSKSRTSISLERGEKAVQFPSEGVTLFYFINLGISLLNLVTIIFVLFNRIRYKYLWFLGLVFMSCVFNIVYIDGSVGFDFIHGPFFLLHHNYYPFTIKVVVPVAAILFWLFYRKRERIRN